jgi:quercetin dioxygenase-like cupin family protein
MTANAIHVQEPEDYVFQNVEMRILLSGEDTGGQFTMIQGSMPSGGDGGLHVHAYEDESMTMLEGEMEVTIGSETFRLTPGQSYFAPRGTPHRLRNLGPDLARSLLIITPGGFDGFIREVGTPIVDGSPTPAEMPGAEQMMALIQIAADYGIRLLHAPSSSAAHADSGAV